MKKHSTLVIALMTVAMFASVRFFGGNVAFDIFIEEYKAVAVVGTMALLLGVLHIQKTAIARWAAVFFELAAILGAWWVAYHSLSILPEMQLGRIILMIGIPAVLLLYRFVFRCWASDQPMFRAVKS